MLNKYMFNTLDKKKLFYFHLLGGASFNGRIHYVSKENNSITLLYEEVNRKYTIDMDSIICISESMTHEER